jgi:two-component system cell cycle response regulator
MKAELRGSDVKCRYGGDEFMVILPDTPIAGARQVSENLRRAIADHPVAWNNGQVIVTASFGITTVSGNEHDPLDAIARADTALYRAKQRGRNGIELEEQTALAS